MAASSVDGSDVRLTLRRILSSRAFYGLRRLQEFLAFVVNETLAGRGEQLKEHTIGVTVYHRPLDYDPKIDAIVRVEAVKLRQRLRLFYEHEGSRAAALIQINKGSYAPSFARWYDTAEPEEVDSLIDKGNYLLFKFYEKFTPDACSLFRQALQTDPTSVQARNGLIHSLWFASAAEALPPLSTMDELASLGIPAQPVESSDTAVSEMIISGFCRGDLSRAVSAGRRALDLDPSNVMATVCAGAVLISIGAMTEAENLFRRSIRLHPGMFFFRCGYTIALYFAGQVERSSEIAAEIASWEPEFWPIRWLLAQIYATLGRYDEAIEAAEAALSVRCPPMALSRLAWLYAVTGKREEAEVALQKLAAITPHSYVAPSGIAAVYAALGRTDEAAIRVRAAVANREPLLGHASVDPRLAPLVRLM